MTKISVSESLARRQSVREYIKQDVSPELVIDILETAGKSPSGGNLQPWRVHALSGEVKNTLFQKTIAQAMNNPTGVDPDIPIYPSGLAEPWRSRRADCGEVMYGALEIKRDNKMGRMQQGARNLSFFDAPVGLIFTLDRSFCESQIIDLGLYVQSVMLVADEKGLATCPQASWSMWAGIVRDVLGLASDEMVMLGMALGYAAPDAPVNQLNQPRVDVTAFTTFHGF